LKRTATSASLHGIGIFEGEPLLFQAFVPIHGRTIKIERTLFVNNYGDAVAVILAIGFFIEFVIKIELVIETAATSPGDSDPEEHAFRKIVLGLKATDFGCGSFGQYDGHGFNSPIQVLRRF
jgi:hypothetical protein